VSSYLAKKEEQLREVVEDTSNSVEEPSFVSRCPRLWGSSEVHVTDDPDHDSSGYKPVARHEEITHMEAIIELDKDPPMTSVSELDDMAPVGGQIDIEVGDVVNDVQELSRAYVPLSDGVDNIEPFLSDTKENEINGNFGSEIVDV